MAAIRRNWSRLSPRLRLIEHDVKTNCSDLNLRLHYPSFRQAQATIDDFVEAISTFIPNFCLPRTELEKVYAKMGGAEPFDIHAALTRLNSRAVELFKKAHEVGNRNGEAGELILYLLTEWLLEAPQILAKMSLKTNSEMPVHGADGIHVRFAPETGRLLIYSGESKLYKDAGSAISAAVTSIKAALSPTAINRELYLVQRDLEFSGLPADARDALLRYLDPFDEHSNERREIITCLIGFSFDGYQKVEARGDEAESEFRALAIKHLRELGPKFAEELQSTGLEKSQIELFFLPVPCVQGFRDKFQDKIGWKRRN